MRIVVSCHPSQGGSGVVATELAAALAVRGHEVHIVACARPFRYDEASGVRFDASTYMSCGAEVFRSSIRNFFAGEIDELRIWSLARTPQQGDADVQVLTAGAGVTPQQIHPVLAGQLQQAVAKPLHEGAVGGRW